jgi:hypothetical protein
MIEIAIDSEERTLQEKRCGQQRGLLIATHER